MWAWGWTKQPSRLPGVPVNPGDTEVEKWEGDRPIWRVEAKVAPVWCAPSWLPLPRAPSQVSLPREQQPALCVANGSPLVQSPQLRPQLHSFLYHHWVVRQKGYLNSLLVVLPWFSCLVQHHHMWALIHVLPVSVAFSRAIPLLFSQRHEVEPQAREVNHKYKAKSWNMGQDKSGLYSTVVTNKPLLVLTHDEVQWRCIHLK